MRNFRLTIALCLTSGLAVAQTAGSITGEVKEQSGTVAPNTATNSETNAARSTVTNTQEIYSFPDLTSGIYQVKVAPPGFATILKSNIELQVQQTARVDFSLSVGQANQTIEAVVSEVIGGWQLGAIVTAQSGQALASPSATGSTVCLASTRYFQIQMHMAGSIPLLLPTQSHRCSEIVRAIA
jgi:hypothetical protein